MEVRAFIILAYTAFFSDGLFGPWQTVQELPKLAPPVLQFVDRCSCFSSRTGALSRDPHTKP